MKGFFRGFRAAVAVMAVGLGILTACMLPVGFPSSGDGQTPAAPSGLAATAGDASVTVTWDGVQGATSYNLYWSQSAGVTTGSGNKIRNVKSPYTQTGLTDGTTYYYVLTAANSAGESAASGPAESYLGIVSGADLINGYVTGGASPTLSWDAVSGAIKYRLKIASTKAGVTGASAVATTSTQYAYPKALSAGGSIYWRVEAVNTDGVAGPWSGVASATYESYSVGDTGPAGGIVFYDAGSYSNGWRYMEAPLSDQSTNASRAIEPYVDVIAAMGTAIGTGKANTAATVTAFANYGDGEASKICASLGLGGYTGWFLPSEGELTQMYDESTVIGGFQTASYTHYWSSTDQGYGGYSWLMSFHDGSSGWGDDTSSAYVRCAREF